MAESRDNALRFNAESREPKNAGDLVKSYLELPDEFRTDKIEDHVVKSTEGQSSFLDLATLFKAFCDAEMRMVQQHRPQMEAMLAEEERRKAEHKTEKRKAEHVAYPSRKAPPPSDPHYISVN
jgi:hypothetical protein